jgi:hypothetical protein
MNTSPVRYPGSTSVTNINKVTSTSEFYTEGWEYSSDVAIKSATSGFFRLKAEGNPLPVLPYSRTIINGSSYMKCSGTGKQIRKSNGVLIGDYSFNYTYVSPIGDHASFASGYASQLNVARNDAKGRLADHISNVMVDLPTDLAEAGKTAHMIRKAVKTAAVMATEFKARSQINRRKLLRLLKGERSGREVLNSLRKGASDLNNLYLEFNYGWKPLVYSIDGALKVLDDQLRTHKHRKKIVGKGVFRDTQNGPIFEAVVPNSNGITVQMYRTTSIEYTVWVGGLLINEGPSSVTQELGLEASNIPSSLWELTYMSFIVDYFSNLGGVIGNLRGSLGQLNVTTLYMSEKTVVSSSLQFVGVKPAPESDNYSFSANGHGSEPGSITTTTFTRTPMTQSSLLVSFNLRQPSGLQIFKTLSVAIQTTGVLRKKW